MAYREDEEKRIYELETAESLSAGTFVPVDKEGNEMAEKFDIGTALDEKVDDPATAPEAGQVLTFDGTGNIWANPPEGVYVINYSDVTDIRDVDIEKATTIPTFLKIDTKQPLTINVPQSSGNPYTVNVQPGTIMSLEEIGSNGTSGTYTGPRFLIFGSRYGNGNSGGVIQTTDFRIICCISLPAFGGVTKALTVNGNMNTTGKLFDSLPPFPITTSFFSGKGPGNPNTNRTENALGVEFQSGGKIRKQVLMPEDIESHDFSSDPTPEQIQFMGWGATSNRAGYRTINEVPTSMSSDEGKVLTVDSNGAPVWGKSGSSVMAVKYTSVPGSGSVLDKTFAEIKAALDNRIPVIMIGPNPNVTFDGQSTIGTEYLVQTYTIDKIVFRSTLLVNPYSEPTNSAVSEIVLSSNDTIEYNKYVPINCSLANMYNAGTITTSTYTIPKNNSWGELTVDASVSSLTLNISNVDTLYPLPPNFVIEITPSAQLTLAVTVTYHYDGEPDDVTTLKHSVSAGNVLEAGKTYQVTVVGSCWTLAEFEA